eukprot:evm.model.scf_964EXC.1 EVM.evm.TU.scf_964EXC.1   scf_964EXC:3156-11457(-)
MVVLLKMLNRDIFSKIAGCVATGKEANVYHAVTSTGSELAIKVYRTSVLTFKDRDRYVTGDFRFRRGYSRHNPRKMVQVWAEKEMRNLTRLSKAGIRCPKPVELKMHILAMDFIGEDARAAPLLKDAKLDADESRKAYCQMLDILWRLYQKCKLVHADLSEFNILHFKDDCYVIDVSQSVDLDHPHALDFLREDCQHVNEFFLKKGVCILTLRELFDFVTDPTVTDNNVQETMAKLIERSESRGLTQGGDVATAVFRRAYIPRRLDDVVDYEADYDKLKKGEDEGIYYQTILGFKKDMSGVSLVPQILEEEAAMQDDVLDPCCTEVNVAQGPTEGGEAGKGDSDREVSGSDSEGSLSAEGREEAQRDATDVRKEKLSKEEMRVVRRENKKAVKEANRVRRESKMPKKLKHKQLKKGKRRDDTSAEAPAIDGGSYRIGCALKPKKESRYLTAQILELARRSGVEMCVVDPRRPLAEQGHFDVIIHKLHLDAAWEDNLLAYTAANPGLKVIDHIDRIRMLQNRSTMLSAIEKEGIVLRKPHHSRTSSDSSVSSNGHTTDHAQSSGHSQPCGTPHDDDARCSTKPVLQHSLAQPQHWRTCVLAPGQATLPEGVGMEEAERILEDAQLGYPLVVKPQWADGRENAHLLALVHDRTALEMLVEGTQPKGLKPPLVVQRYVEHGGVLYKVFVVGSRTLCLKRPSLSLHEGVPREVRPGTGLQLLPRVSSSKGSLEDEYLNGNPPNWLTTALSNVLRKRLGLQLFNFDLICPRPFNGIYYIVDINYFPGVSKIRGFERIFVDFLLAACRGV